MPALIATLVLYLIAGFIFFLPDQFRELSIETLLSQLYLVNIYFWRTINYFGLQADHVPLLHMWSLSIEEQFYIFYPLGLLLVYKLGRRFLVPILLGVFVMSFALGVVATGWKPEASFYLLPTRAWELMAGGVLAVLLPRGTVPGRFEHVAGPLGLAVLVFALAIHTPLTPFPGWYAALPVAASVLLLMSGPNTPVGRVLSWGPAVWIGKISYPLYLVHWPVIILLRAGVDDVTIVWRWAGFAVSILLAWGIWALVERPVRTGRILQTPRSLLLAAASTIAVLCLLALVGWQTQGLPSRFSSESRALLAYADDLPQPFLDCEIKPRDRRTTGCLVGDASGTPDVVIIGDSHAQALAGAVDIWLQEQGRSGALYIHHGCMPLADLNVHRCGDFMEVVQSKITSDAGVKNVVLISSWRHEGLVFKGQMRTGSEADAAFVTALTTSLEEWRGQGMSVTLVDPLFYAANQAPQTLARNLHFGSNWPIDRPVSVYDEKTGAVRGAFATAAQADDVQQVSLISDLCQSGICRATVDGLPVFTDNNHIRFGMSDYFAQRLGAIDLQ